VELVAVFEVKPIQLGLPRDLQLLLKKQLPELGQHPLKHMQERKLFSLTLVLAVTVFVLFANKPEHLYLGAVLLGVEVELECKLGRVMIRVNLLNRLHFVVVVRSHLAVLHPPSAEAFLLQQQLARLLHRLVVRLLHCRAPNDEMVVLDPALLQ
jgi:hypothetical protein